MNTVERVLTICRGRKCPVSRLERDLGFGNGYVRSLTKGEFPADRAKEIARYFEMPVDYLLGGLDEYGLSFEDWNYIGIIFCNYAYKSDKYESYVSVYTGISLLRITWFFAGAVNLRVSEIEKIADCLNVKLQDIIGKYADNFFEKNDSFWEDRLDAFTVAAHNYSGRLSEKDKNLIISMMKSLAHDVKENGNEGPARNL